MISKIAKNIALIALFASSAWASGVQTEKSAVDVYTIDTNHSKLGFKVSHLGISSVTGYFKDFSGELQLEGSNLVGAQAEVKVPTVFTDNDKRDDHLRGDDFFSAEKFPSIKFVSTKVSTKGKLVEMTGDLTIRDVTRSVVLSGTFGGKVHVEMWKMSKTGLSLKGVINRQDFGLTFSKFLGTGEAMVGDEVEISIDIEADHKD